MMRKAETIGYLGQVSENLDMNDDTASRCHDRLDELSRLQDGWLDGEGVAIQLPAIAAATRLVAVRPALAELAHIYPTCEGGLLFEAVVGNWDISIEFRGDGSMDLTGVRTDGPSDMEAGPFRDGMDGLLGIVDMMVGDRISANRLSAQRSDPTGT